MLFNSTIWKRQNLTEKYRKLGAKYTTHLLCADQTLLNTVLCGQFAPLPHYCNTRWFPTDKVINNQKSVIFHFVGSPKPWDLFGKNIHSAYCLWESYNPSFWAERYNSMSYQKIYRTWKIKKSILRCLLNQLKNKRNASVNYHPTNL